MKKLIILQCVLAGVLASGCSSYMQEAREAEAREAHQRMSVASDVTMLKERLKGIEAAQEQISVDIRNLKELVAKVGEKDRELSAKLSETAKALEARDTQMHKETIAILSKKIAEIMRSQMSSAPTVSGTGVEHVVESGQTLSAIAQAYGVTVSAIVKAHNISNPNTVKVGQKLFIPR